MDQELLPLAGDFEPATRERWLALVEKALRGADFEQTLVTRTYDDIAVEPLYRAGDIDGVATGLPGAWPYLRGFASAGSSRGGWQIRQLHSHPDPATANSNILEDLDRGVNAVLLRLDRAFAQDEGDPDGIMAYTVRDLRTVLDRVDLATVSLMLDAGPRFVEAGRLLLDLVDERAYDAARLEIAFAADPVGGIARGRCDPEKALPRAIALADEIAGELPKSSSLLANGIPYHAAGGSNVQEIAATIATGIDYLREATEAGMDVATAASQIELMLAADADIFSTIAKLRATRRLWGQVLCSSGLAEPTARLHARTPTRMLSQRDPWVNMLRTTVAAMGAAMGGADSITILPFDHVLGEPDALARRIARNIQLICMEESGLDRVIDPVGGSFYVEKLTNEFAERGWAMVQAIEADGGMLRALRLGTVQDSLAQTFIQRLESIARRRDGIIGVSLYPDLDERPRVPAEPDITTLTDTAGLAVEHAADFESIAAPLGSVRSAEPFERLREISDNRLLLEGARPRIYLARPGTMAAVATRSAFARNAFEAGGIETVSGEPTADLDQLAAAFGASGCRAVCLCSSDVVYAERGAEAARLLKAAGAEAVFLAGPVDETLKDAGVDTFIHDGCNLLAVLENLHSLLLGEPA